MSPNQAILLAFYIFAVFSVFQVGNVEGIRLCGRRLADIVNFICEKHGGFHVPRIKRDVSASSKSENLPPAGTIMQSIVRRSEPNAATSELGGMFIPQGGIVDECCKKQCTLSTLVSYCANSKDIETINLQELFPSEVENMPIISEEAIAELPQVPFANHQFSHYSRKAHGGRPKLGLSNRDRSVFIVLSQLQEDEDKDKALGEYGF